MTILLTGATSFIGRHLISSLADAGFHVIGSYRNEAPAISELQAVHKTIEFRRINLSNDADYKALPNEIDAIINVAGVSLASAVDVEDMLACNISGMRCLLKYAARAHPSRIIHASTVSVHGDIESEVLDENTPINNADLYGASKYVAERLLALHSGGIPAVALRLPGVLGRGAHRAWLPTMLQRARANQEIVIHSPAQAFNNATHVREIGALCVRLLRHDWRGFHAFPLGAGHAISVEEVTQRVLRATGSASRVTVRGREKHGFTISSDYATRNFGYDAADMGALLERYMQEELSGRYLP
jgi:nucleoside-diphosphate-sugar epimerase